jgi:hypothetical protein
VGSLASPVDGTGGVSAVLLVEELPSEEEFRAMGVAG